MGDAIATGESLKDRYRLERLLGRGGMAMVWLGHDEVLERPVAVKVLSEAMVGDPDFVARFRREARLAASLSHANLVDVFDFSEEGERPYLVMQFVPGDDLAAHVRRGEPVDCERLARELLDAVAHIHAAGIVHRDIKPQNILLEPDGTAKLLDFGIAQPHDATALTQAGLVLATKRYAAPEVMAGQPASERSDLYSCGVVLRYCRGEAPSASDSLVDWLTHPDPAARPASARQALALLERRTTSAAEPTQAFQPTRAFRPFDSREPAHRRARARPGWGAVGALVAIAAAAAFAVVLGTGGGGGQGAKQGAHAAVRGGGGDGTQAGRSRPEARQVASTVPRPAGEDPSLGSALNEEGFALIQAGRYAAAVPVLEEAVRAFPPQTDDIDYAYALFNLGDALRRSGRPEAAIPVLERRLEIPDQTDVVQRELDAARAEAG